MPAPFDQPIDAHALDQLFLKARTYRAWQDTTITDDQLRQIYDLLKWAPTSANTNPARFVWVRSPAGRARLAAHASEGNRERILTAPVTVIIGYDLKFAEHLPKLTPPHMTQVFQALFAKPDMAESTAIRNGGLQAAYLIMAARALGFDCGPLSGFDQAAVDRDFFADTTIRSNMLCILGHGADSGLAPRGARLSFEDAGWLA